MKRIHYVGIGGAGMSALAAIDLARGLAVSGSDTQWTDVTDRLARAGARVARGHAAETIGRQAPELVVTTAAVNEQNPEVAEARRLGIPVTTRAAYLGLVMADHGGPRIAVAGTHGKSTATSMLASILVAAGVDPTVLIGADWPPIGGNVRMGQGGWFLTEACEAYESFLELRPDAALVTNVEADHLDHYGSLEGVEGAFRRFAECVQEGGLLVVCGDDPGARNLASDAGRRSVLYGLGELSEGYSGRIEAAGAAQIVTMSKRSAEGEIQFAAFRLPVPGRHNALNALGAAALAAELGVEFRYIREGLEGFRGAERRFDLLGERDGVVVVDDYAHHPTEIASTLQAARQAYTGRKLVAVFQPHLYTRTRDFMEQFADSLSGADAVILTDIYAAREPFDPEVRIPDLVRGIAARRPEASVLYVASKSDIPSAIAWLAQSGDVALFMGAGDIREAAEAYLCQRPQSRSSQ